MEESEYEGGGVVEWASVKFNFYIEIAIANAYVNK